MGASVALCLWCALLAHGQATNTAVEGRRISEIRIVDEAGHVLDDKLPPIALQRDKPFNMEQERSRLRSLYAPGRYAQIHTEAAPEGDAIRIDFVVRRNLYNNVIRIEGIKEPPTDAGALGALRLPLGEPFGENALNDALT